MTYPLPTGGAHRQPDWDATYQPLPRPQAPMQLVQTSPHWSFVFRNVAVGVAALLISALVIIGALGFASALDQIGNDVGTSNTP